MAGITGMGTTYDLPQLTGALFAKGRRPNAALRGAGGFLGGIQTISASEFPLTVEFDLEDPSQPAILEGADAPNAKERTLTQAKNIVQIFFEAVQLSYGAQSNRQTFAGLQIIPGGVMGALQDPADPAFQLGLRVQQIARDLNFTILNGVYQLPTSNATARKTRGLISAITTNYTAAGGARALTTTIVEAALKGMVSNGSMNLGDNLFAFCGINQFENLVDLYKTATVLPVSRTVVGVQVRTIITTWGELNVVWDPDVPSLTNDGEIFLLDLASLRVVGREIVDDGVRKGVLFTEPLAKQGASSKWQVYGEFGLNYGHESRHARIDDLND